MKDGNSSPDKIIPEPQETGIPNDARTIGLAVRIVEAIQFSALPPDQQRMITKLNNLVKTSN